MGKQTHKGDPNIDEKELLELIHQDQIVGVTELAEHFDVTRKGMRDKLDDLAADGEIVCRKIGRTNVYIDGDLIAADGGSGAVLNLYSPPRLDAAKRFIQEITVPTAGVGFALGAVSGAVLNYDILSTGIVLAAAFAAATFVVPGIAALDYWRKMKQGFNPLERYRGGP